MAIYRFSHGSEIAPVSFDFSDGYWVLHRKLELEGKIHHTAKMRPDRLHPKPIRMGAPEQGWTELGLLRYGGAN